MKIIFFGTSEFAVPSLEAITRSGHDLLAVVTQPDRKKGRDLKMSSPPVKTAAKALGVKNIYQPANPCLDTFIKKLKTEKPDLFCVVSYGEILDKKLLTTPSKFCINMHGSLLPKYRGASPVHWAILDGCKRTGVTAIKMNEFMDRGDIITEKTLSINPNDTYISLSEKLSQLGAEILLDTVDMIESGKFSLKPQDEAQASYAPKLKKKDGLIDWQLDAVQIHNRVRGLLPWPGTYTFFKGKLLKILETKLGTQAAEGKPGEVISTEGGKICIATGSGVLNIKQVQPADSKQMEASAFLAGHKLKEGDILGCRS